MKRTMEVIRAKMACSLNRQKYGNLGNCDVCEDQNPRCYCAADEAYLCDYCDESVHGVNSLALNHERVTLDRDESVHMVPHIVRRAASNESIYPSQTKHGSFNGFNFHCRNFRSFQYKKHLPIVDAKEVIAVQNSSKVGGITYTRGTKVKQKPDSRLQDELNMRELSSVYHKCTEPSQNCSSFHEVPVLVRVAQEMPASTILADACTQPTLAAHSEDSSECNSMGFIVPDHCNVDDYLVSNTDLISKEEEASVVSSPKLAFKAEEKTWWESEKNQSILESSLVTEESQQIISYNYEKYFTDDLQLKYLDLNVLKHSGMPEAEYCRQTFVPLLRVCEKLKVERAEETEQINQLLEATIGRPLHITSKEARNQKSFNLRLNFEDVLSAWSDRGCFTTDCQWPRTRPPNLTSGSTDEVSLDVGIVPVIEPKTVNYLEQKEEAQAFATTEKNGEREARVLRYREKRQTRLFSKTIRYEVRKMNADRRPRIKGRFVKRHVEVLKP